MQPYLACMKARAAEISGLSKVLENKIYSIMESLHKERFGRDNT